MENRHMVLLEQICKGCWIVANSIFFIAIIAGYIAFTNVVDMKEHKFSFSNLEKPALPAKLESYGVKNFFTVDTKVTKM